MSMHRRPIRYVQPVPTLKPFNLRSVAAALVLIAAVLSCGINGRVLAGDGKGRINTIGSKGVAIQGYDPVAYFTAGRPVKGQAQHSVKHSGATWHFASGENKALFQANPEKYVPAYGGYCAYGVSKGGLYKIEPDAWSIRDGRLFLNYDRKVQATWSKAADGYIQAADRKWPGLAAK